MIPLPITNDASPVLPTGMEPLTDKSKRQINKHFRYYDESDLWPISGRFSAVDRAIRRLSGHIYIFTYNVEYIDALESEISNIYQVDRGYENFDKRLAALGADIKRT